MYNYAFSFRDYEKETVNYDLDKDDNKGKKNNKQMNLLSTAVLKNDNSKKTLSIITVMLEKLEDVSINNEYEYENDFKPYS